MKYPELSCNVYAEVDGENVLLIEIDREGRAKVYHENLRIDGVQKIFAMVRRGQFVLSAKASAF